MVDSVTEIFRSGHPGKKLDIAVLGDGFTESDQLAYNNKVQELLLGGVFIRDYFYEDMQAFNIYRVNLISNQSGISRRVYDENGTPNDSSDDILMTETIIDTALGFIYNGSWSHSWIEWNTATDTRVENALNTWVPDRDIVVIILNTPGWGANGGGGYQRLTMAANWAVMAHEFGHGIGGLADEYCRTRPYTGVEPNRPNVTINTNRATIKWNRLINPTTPIPTGIGACANYNQGPKPVDWSDSQDVGLFEGGNTYDLGVYRPVVNCCMRDNYPPYCAVCYTALKNRMHKYTDHSFLKCYTGDFNGDGKDDVLVHNDNSINVYRSDGSKLNLIFRAIGSVPGSWYFSPTDQFYVGDFNGDGKDEVVVYNSQHWIKRIFGLLVDDGNNGLKLVIRYEDGIPGWPFQDTDKFYVADFDGDGKKDLFVYNGSEWAIPYFGMLRSNGAGFSVIQRYDGNMPGWQMKPQDRHYVGDFNGDGKKDLFVYNGSEWATAYLGMFRSSGSNLSIVNRYDGNIPGWQMSQHDRHFISDVNGDGKSDLFVYNLIDWSQIYLGTMISNGTALSSTFKEGSIGEWKMEIDDIYEPCNYEGIIGQRDLIVHNRDWLGMICYIPPANNLILHKIYYKWIHNYHYGRNW